MKPCEALNIKVNNLFQAVEFIAEHLRNEDEYVQVLLLSWVEVFLWVDI